MENAESNADLCAATGTLTVGNHTLNIAPLTRAQVYSLFRYVNVKAKARWFPQEQLPALLEFVPPADKARFIIDWLRANQSPPRSVIYDLCAEAETIQYFVFLLARDLNKDLEISNIIVADPDKTLIDLQDACGCAFITQSLNLPDPTPVPVPEIS